MTEGTEEGIGLERAKQKAILPKTGRLLLDMVKSLVTTAERTTIRSRNVSRKRGRHTVLMSKSDDLGGRNTDNAKKA